LVALASSASSFVQPLLVGVVAPESGRPLELTDDRVKRAVLMVGRAEVTQVGVWLRLKSFLQFHRQPRLADPRLARSGDMMHISPRY
jgi:hypothetical protein